MTRVALLEYFTHPDGVVIALAHPDLDRPVVVEADPMADGSTVTARTLELCAVRLLVDFHGLPIDFHGLPTGRDVADGDAYADALRLPPAVNAAKRMSPILVRKLAIAAFRYGLDYWQQLGAALLPQALRGHLADRELLCVVPHGPLHSLPFAALRWDPASLVIDHFGVVHAPSASVLRYCQARNRQRMGEHRPSSALVAGLAAVDDDDPSNFETEQELLHTLIETRALVGPGGSAAATKSALTGLMGGFDVVHVACHGIFGADVGLDPMEASGLLLSADAKRPSLRVVADRDAGLLSPRQVMGLRLNADLVTLRACSTGRLAVLAGDELLGLIRAFLYAGTPSLITTLWNVNILSSRALLSHFYRGWLANPGPEKWQSLRDAQLAIRGTTGLEHPFHWAGFTLVGDWK